MLGAMEREAEQIPRPLQSETRLLFRAALAIFTVTVGIGLFNGLHIIQLPQQVLLTHVHAGTLGWITLSVAAVCFWMFGNSRTAGVEHRLPGLLALAMGAAVPVYIVAFLSGNPVARAIFGTPVLLLIFALLAWTVAAARSLPMTVPRLGVIAALVSLSVGSTIGVLVQIELAVSSTFLPEGAIGAHVSAQVVGYLVLVGMSVAEWQLIPERRTLSWPGVIQVVLLFLGGILVAVGALLNVQPLLGAFIPLELIALVIYVVRIGPRIVRVRWSERGGGRHFALAAPFLVANLGLLLWLIVGVTVTKTYARFEAIPVWLIFAFDHTMFIGVMSNSLFGLIQEFTRQRRAIWAFADDVVFYGMNLGMLGFVGTLVTDSRALEKLFTPIMGGSILVGIVAYSMRLLAIRPPRSTRAEISRATL
jgi:hypothetical protein